VSVPHLWIAAAVRPHHAHTFIEEWIRHSWETGTLWEAFGETHLMTWPDNAGQGGQASPEEERYHDIEDEILELMLEELAPAITEAFTRTATEVLERERKRQSNAR
jgi:hypothetical protein